MSDESRPSQPWAPARPATPSYPVVSTKTLHPPVATGWRALGTPRREAKDLPRLDGHQVAVYRTRGALVEDHGGLDLRSETAVSATSVTVVDKRRNVPVEAMVTVPAADSTDFAVRARFLCTVVDAVTLVREGHADAAAALAAYLQACHGLAEQCLGHDASSRIAEARRQVAARVTAFSVAEPPRLPGMTAELVGVELLTPTQLREFHQKLDELDRRRKQDEVEQAVAHERNVREREHQQQLELMTKQHEEELARREQEATLRLDEQRQAYEREQEALDAARAERMGWREALLSAFRRKELTAEQLAERLSAAEREVREAEERRDEKEWALLEKISEVRREELKREIERFDRRFELQRLEKVRELEVRRDERLKQSKEQRDDLLRHEGQQREDLLRKEREKRIRADREQEMYFELYKKLIQEGHTATTPIDMPALLERIIAKGNQEPGSDDPGQQLESGGVTGSLVAGEPGPDSATGTGGARSGGAEDVVAEETKDDVPYGGDTGHDTYDIGEVGREENGY
ncbi:hypothetical protein ACFXDH_21505 [Streptomyces sp. NPDC059467]|uniref:hypothetical protein n=1 Tax=Streptomyces sp. NPDC059467 TaxID=3346844 RepID=UPI00367538B1